MNTRKLPIGIQDFQDLRENDYLYIDKTAAVYNLVTRGKPYFLGRPRRFGKSLLVSTLKAYFEGKKELFEGLAVATLEKDWTVYPVLHIDLMGENYDGIAGLEAGLDMNLRLLEKEWGRDPADDTASARLFGLIQRAAEKTGKKVV
ncbi:MAG: AAA family ATPase, partial [Treponema sp.]|nr:AAA family ATPase [Treponema sp.]